MPKRATVFLLFAACAMHPLTLPPAALADEAKTPVKERQWGENRWVPSLAVSGGANIQLIRGNVDSEQFADSWSRPDRPPGLWIPLEGYYQGDDRFVVPFVSASLEIMTPAFDIPTRPRLFVSGEILPTFASTRSLAVNGDPGCIRGPEPGAPCAVDEVRPERDRAFGEESANGEGSRTNATMNTLAYGSSVGVALPFRIGDRQLRFKTSFSWLSYKVEANGVVSNATCFPPPVAQPPNSGACSNYYTPNPLWPAFPPEFEEKTGLLRLPSMLSGNASKRFNGIGPGFDLEMDAFRWGPLGASLFLGGRAYYILGNREISFEASHVYTEPGPFNGQETTARWSVEVDKWLFRAHVGLRINWLGMAN